MRKTFAVFFLSLLFISFTVPIYAGLVPCGLSEDDPDQPGDQTVPCTLCDFFVMIDGIIKFLLTYIVPALAALMIAIGGFMYIVAYAGPAEMLTGGQKGGPKLLSQAKRLFTSVAFGLLIIYGAWLIVNTFLMAIGVTVWQGPGQGWWIIPCP